MDKLKVYNELKDKFNQIYLDESMKKHTSFKTGGNADILIKPENVNEIQEIFNYCDTNTIPHLVIGNGTNLLVKDSGIRGVVIKLSNNLNSYKIEGEYITAGAGTSVIALSNEAYNNGLGGLEFACGIPGTLGGAIKMNAGCFKGEMSDVVYKTKYLDENNEIQEITENLHRFEYRKSIFHENEKLIILESTLKLYKKDKQEIKEIMEHNNSVRREKQPTAMPSAGSSFKRPEGYFPGQLIEDCGLKGYKIGGAEVSTLHANFIVNSGNATSKDVLDLMDYVKQKVKEKFNVQLEEEIQIIGED